MAILKEGINGPFSGKVGSVVGYQLNGQNIIRGLPVVIKRKPTELTLINRGRMKAVSEFLAPLKRILKFGYRSLAPHGSRVGTFQMAQSYTFKNAIDYGEGNVPYVNPEKVLVFRGEGTPPPPIEVTRDAHILRFTWDKVRCRAHGSSLITLAYDLTSGAIWFNEGGANGSAGEFVWDLHLEGGQVNDSYQLHIYVGFHNILRGELSDSVYVGCV